MAHIKTQEADSDRRIRNFDWRKDLEPLKDWGQFFALPKGAELVTFGGTLCTVTEPGAYQLDGALIQCACQWDKSLCGKPGAGFLLEEISENERSVWE